MDERFHADLAGAHAQPCEDGQGTRSTGFWTLVAFTAGIFVSALFHPFLIASLLWFLVVEIPMNPLPTISNYRPEPCLRARLWRGHACRRDCPAKERTRWLVVYHCHHAILLASHLSRRLEPCGNSYLRPSPGIKPNTDCRSFRTSDRCHPHQWKACASGAAKERRQ